MRFKSQQHKSTFKKAIRKKDKTDTRLMAAIMSRFGTAEMTISSTPPMRWTNISASRADRTSAVCKQFVSYIGGDLKV